MKIFKQINTCVLTLILLVLSYSAHAQITNDITHKEAFEILLAAKKNAKYLNVPVNIAIVDAGANLKAFIRMDESFLGSVDVAIKKAKTARYFNIDTGKLGELT